MTHNIKFTPDDFTLRHLRDWFKRGQAPCAEDMAEQSEKRMIAFLQTLDTEDAEYAMGQGWSHVFYRATQSLPVVPRAKSGTIQTRA
jgi:hypothetical protein